MRVGRRSEQPQAPFSGIKNSDFHQKLTFFEEIWQHGGHSENIQEKCYLDQGIIFLCDLFLPCL